VTGDHEYGGDDERLSSVSCGVASGRRYRFVENADALYDEYAARGVEFTRALGDTPWHSREFVVKDCDGRLLAFGADSD
jgi:uncharacterized glyoxalase superfamily protein PhnB